jgi:hypothetical protein
MRISNCSFYSIFPRIDIFSKLPITKIGFRKKYQLRITERLSSRIKRLYNKD